ncbi:P-loop containing nucleoside triphosphate hydrolase protein [Artomyces pyxidatus]|uniref:P-loop containing nucleoside triphosphate hydrolase protein n=1 Tax=Artomyces pyxidatus TaxID=48021 RepID=A0ACB8SIK4_9AGAM|nr:P-loop containing nucleoside triphosphate hydrolase protein [Artomyces pyxidatus]
MSTDASASLTRADWLAPEQRSFIQQIITQLIPQWSTGPRDFQLSSWARTLQGISQINIVPCAGGKTALFYGPILIIQHLVKEGIPFKVRGRPPPKKPVMLVVGPLVELQNSQVSEMKEVGVRAVAVNAESLQMHGRKLFDQIRRCEWSVVLLSPERLTSKELDVILRDQEFRRNVIGLGLDELHVYESWGDDFRPKFHQVSLARKRLPDDIPLIGATGTLPPGREYDEICRLLGLRIGTFVCHRESCERSNLRIAIHELTHSLDGFKFPDIAWVVTPGQKVVIYCLTIDLGFRVALYLWNQLPAGERRRKQVRLWNSLTSTSHNRQTLELFRDNPHCYVIVATIAFGMGMNPKNIRNAINLGVPKSLNQWLQQINRGGRDGFMEATGRTYVESSLLDLFRARWREGLEAEPPIIAGDLALKTVKVPEEKVKRGGRKKKEAAKVVKDNKKGKGRATKTSRSKTSAKSREAARKAARVAKLEAARAAKLGAMDEGIRRLLQAHVDGGCLVAEQNAVYENPGEASMLPCVQAKRAYPCSNCQPFWDSENPCPRPSSTSTMAADASDELSGSRIVGPSLPPALTQAMRGHALGKLRLFAHERWKSLDRSVARFLPSDAFWPHGSISKLLSNFHLIRCKEMLDSLMEGWEYLERDGAGLFDLIDGLNTRYDERRRHSKVISAQKAARTRARKKAKLVADKAAQASPVLDARAPSSPPPPPATSDAIPHQFHPLDLAIPPATPYTPTRASRRHVSPSPYSHSRSQSMTLNEYGGSSESAFYRPDWPGLPEQYNQPYRVAMPESPRLATRSQLAAYSTRSPLTPRRSRTANYFSGLTTALPPRPGTENQPHASASGNRPTPVVSGNPSIPSSSHVPFFHDDNDVTVYNNSMYIAQPSHYHGSLLTSSSSISHHDNTFFQTPSTSIQMPTIPHTYTTYHSTPAFSPSTLLSKRQYPWDIESDNGGPSTQRPRYF